MIALEIGSSAAWRKKTGTNKIKSILQHLNDTEIANTLLPPLLLTESFTFHSLAFRVRISITIFRSHFILRGNTTFSHFYFRFYSFYLSLRSYSLFKMISFDQSEIVWEWSNFMIKNKMRKSFKFVVIHLFFCIQESQSEFIVRQFS